MSEHTSKASITGMREGYSEYAVSQHNAIANGLERAVSQLVDTFEINQTNDSYINLVDLGSADGVNSFPVIESFSRALNKKRTALNLMVSHVDLPSADFNGLSHNIYQHECSYRQTLTTENKSVHSVIVPGSFYDSFLPENSADILFSTTALHYASRRASILSKHVHPLCATGNEEKSAWEELSATDLNTALNHIHSSLKSGGKFWAVVPAHSRDDLTGEINNYWYREVLDVMSGQLLELVDKGIVDEESWNNFVLPVHQRHLHQWQKWFADNDSMFQLDFLYEEEQSNPYLQRFRNTHQDPNFFADDYLSSVRAWSEKIIMQLLPETEQRNMFFGGLRNQFVQSPDRFENDTFSVYVGATCL